MPPTIPRPGSRPGSQGGARTVPAHAPVRAVAPPPASDPAPKTSERRRLMVIAVDGAPTLDRKIELLRDHLGDEIELIGDLYDLAQGSVSKMGADHAAIQLQQVEAERIAKARDEANQAAHERLESKMLEHHQEQQRGIGALSEQLGGLTTEMARIGRHTSQHDDADTQLAAELATERAARKALEAKAALDAQREAEERTQQREAFDKALADERAAREKNDAEHSATLALHSKLLTPKTVGAGALGLLSGALPFVIQFWPQIVRLFGKH